MVFIKYGAQLGRRGESKLCEPKLDGGTLQVNMEFGAGYQINHGATEMRTACDANV